MKIKFIDFCSGIGAGRLGLELAGMDCIAHSEINTDADLTYQRFFNDLRNLGDLTQIIPEQLPDFDLMIAGFPCQTFSIVGQRRGFDDVRGQIIYYLANILKAKNVPYFILENVKGLVNHNHGTTIKTIVALLESCGYVVNFRVLNSSHFGVPQLRERVYFVGIRHDLYTHPFLFPNGNMKSNMKISDFLLDDNSNELQVSDATFQRYLHNKYNHNRVNIDEILENDYLILDTRQSDLRIYKNMCPTLRTGRHGVLYTRNKKLLRLSGLEGLLLQGFSKNFLLSATGIPDSKLLAQTGNAMTVNVIHAIGAALTDYIKYGGSND